MTAESKKTEEQVLGSDAKAAIEDAIRTTLANARQAQAHAEGRVKAEAIVQCGGRTHRIEITDKGRLRLCDHPRRFWKTLEMQEAIGMDCQCAKVLKAYREASGYYTQYHPNLPDALSGHLRARYEKRRGRAEGTWLGDGTCFVHKPDPLKVPLHARLAGRVQYVATEVLSNCDYVRLYSDKEHNVDVGVTLGGKPQCDGGTETLRYSDQRSTSWWSIGIRFSWLMRVHAVGLALVKGRFVLDAKPYSDRVWQIAYVTQGRGFKLVKKHGFAIQQPDRKFVLARHHGQVPHVYG
jgi:hypothetical protein